MLRNAYSNLADTGKKSRVAGAGPEGDLLVGDVARRDDEAVEAELTQDLVFSGQLKQQPDAQFPQRAQHVGIGVGEEWHVELDAFAKARGLRRRAHAAEVAPQLCLAVNEHRRADLVGNHLQICVFQPRIKTSPFW
ncbi:hypothetical protein [Saccharopolyspora hattusasensis]|uniref:hypothetical protein n=1 Tax=Saccharopolyspora hattusasensis TaxID=1128679 RepID=UPI003D99C693